MAIKFSAFPHRKIRLRPLNLKIIIFYCAVLSLFVYFVHRSFGYILYYNDEDDKGGEVDLKNNYFQSEEKLLGNGLLVDYQKCRIPSLDIWSHDVTKQPFHDNSEYNCKEKQAHVTYVKGENVIINSTVLAELGYSLRTVTCCYRTIKRIEQTITSYDNHADVDFKISCDCKKMDRVTRPTSPFIKVICHSNLLRLEPFSYINFHALPLFKSGQGLGHHEDNSKEERVTNSKVKFWKDCVDNVENSEVDTTNDGVLCKKVREVEHNTLPNVLIIGIDSTSRMNFRRFLKKSVMKLETIGAVEMKGFTKVGHNTLPNFIPLTTSYSLDEIEKTCFVNSSDPFDDCPFVWKEFSKQKYITAHLEDSPNLAIFNFLKTGFVEQPTDFYIRPLMLAIYKYMLRDYSITCVGYQRPEEIILNFALELLRSAAERNTPAFITTWITDLTHEHMNSVEVMDDILAGTIDKLVKYELLQNTVLMVISDHGYRFLPIRRTLSGWYEGSLPAFWMHIPESVQKLLPSSRESLLENSRLLTTPYDVHATLKHILKLNYNSYESSEDEFRVRNGVSIFSAIPSRSCEEAGVPQEYCTCKMPVRYDANETVIQKAAYAALGEINSVLAPAMECTPLKLSYVYLSGVIRGESYHADSTLFRAENNTHNLYTKDSLLIGFVTYPGSFMFDSRVDYDLTSGSFTKVVKFVRTDQIQVFPRCVKNLTPILEELCVCK